MTLDPPTSMLLRHVEGSSELLEDISPVIFHPTGASLPGNFPRHPGVEANTPETLAFV